MVLAHTPTEEVATPDNLALQDALATVAPNVNAPGVGANMTMLRVNQAGVPNRLMQLVLTRVPQFLLLKALPKRHIVLALRKLKQ